MTCTDLATLLVRQSNCMSVLCDVCSWIVDGLCSDRDDNLYVLSVVACMPILDLAAFDALRVSEDKTYCASVG